MMQCKNCKEMTTTGEVGISPDPKDVGADYTICGLSMARVEPDSFCEEMQLADGVYFGLPDYVYHNQKRLSASGIKLFNQSPYHFWHQSWMNPDREIIQPTDAMKKGTAYHKMILEGREAFEACYAVAPDKEDYPDALHGKETLVEKCVSLGLKKTGTIASLTDAIRAVDTEAVFWSDILDNWKIENKGKETISRDWYLEIAKADYFISQCESFKGLLTGGEPEVSIFWHDENGLPMKARLDYLKITDAGLEIYDLKTTSNRSGKSMRSLPAAEIASWDYGLQAVIYVEGLKAALQFSDDQLHNAPDWFSGAKQSDVFFTFIFALTGNLPMVTAARFNEREDLGGNGFSYNEYWKSCRYRLDAARKLFKTCVETFGTKGTPWIPDYGVSDLKDVDMPIWYINKG